MLSNLSTVRQITNSMPILRGTIIDRHGIDRLHYQVRPDVVVAGQQPADVYCLSWPERAGLIPLGARVDFVVRSRPPGASHLVDVVGILGLGGPADGRSEWTVLGSSDFVRTE